MGQASCGPPTYCSLWAGPIYGPPTFPTSCDKSPASVEIQIVNINVQKVCQSAPKHTTGRLKIKKFMPDHHRGGAHSRPSLFSTSILAPLVPLALACQIWSYLWDASATYATAPSMHNDLNKTLPQLFKKL